MKMRFLILIVLFFYCIFLPDSFSQQNYIQDTGNFITVDELTILAEEADFEGGISTEILRDKKSTYFAIDRNKLDSRYLELRILEQVYADKVIVYIGQSKPNNFMLLWKIK